MGLDRRWKEARGASKSQSSRADALVRRQLGVVRSQYNRAQAYGGSTGGRRSINDSGATDAVFQAGNRARAKTSAFFKAAGGGNTFRQTFDQ